VEIRWWLWSPDRVEETSDIGKLEIATEREIQRGLTIEKNLSQSWEDLSLVSLLLRKNTMSGMDSI
jgi:hypothetical protein